MTTQRGKTLTKPYAHVRIITEKRRTDNAKEYFEAYCSIILDKEQPSVAEMWNKDTIIERKENMQASSVWFGNWQHALSPTSTGGSSTCIAEPC